MVASKLQPDSGMNEVTNKKTDHQESDRFAEEIFNLGVFYMKTGGSSRGVASIKAIGGAV